MGKVKELWVDESGDILINQFDAYRYALKGGIIAMSSTIPEKKKWTPPNAPLLKLKLEKEKAKQSQAKYFKIKRIVPFSCKATSNVKFYTPIMNSLIDDTDKHPKKPTHWAVCELYIPGPPIFKEIKKEVYDKNYSPSMGVMEPKIQKRVGVEIPKLVYFNITTPKFHDAELSTKIKNHMKQRARVLFFIENHYEDNLIGENTTLALLSNKNWEFTDKLPKSYLEYNQYNNSFNKDFKTKILWRKPDENKTK